MAEKLNQDAVYRAAKKDTKDYMLNDGGGLYLVVGKSGTKLWRFVYTFDGKRKKQLQEPTRKTLWMRLDVKQKKRKRMSPTGQTQQA